MSTTWEEASKCPADGSTGKVVDRKSSREGQLVTIECLLTRCEYFESGWVVQIRPDNTIPDKVDPQDREKRFTSTSMSTARRQMVIDALAQQVANEQRAGSEVPQI